MFLRHNLFGREIGAAGLCLAPQWSSTNATSFLLHFFLLELVLFCDIFMANNFVAFCLAGAAGYRVLAIAGPLSAMTFPSTYVS